MFKRLSDGLPDDVERTALNLGKDAGDILTDYAQGHQIDTGKK